MTNDGPKPKKRARPLPKISENCYHPAGMASCVASYLDVSGIRHTVELEAESLYEAAALALRTFREHNCEPGVMGKLEVEIRSSVTHALTVQKLETWLRGGAKSPREAVMKERLRSLL